MEDIQVYSEKLDSTIVIDNESIDDACVTSLDDSSLVGWTHHGWNNSDGGGSW